MVRIWKEGKNSHKKHKIPGFWFMTLAFLASLRESLPFPSNLDRDHDPDLDLPLSNHSPTFPRANLSTCQLPNRNIPNSKILIGASQRAFARFPLCAFVPLCLSPNSYLAVMVPCMRAKWPGKLQRKG